jgi:hypothetical protein
VSPGKKLERRTLHRVVKRIPVTFESGTVRGKGHIKNVSKQGLFVRCSAILPKPGADVTVRFADRKGRGVELHGKVRWTTQQLDADSPALPGFGVNVAPGQQAFTEFFEQILFV